MKEQRQTVTAQEELVLRVRLLRRAGVPKTWTQFCAEVWARLDEADVSIANVDEVSVREVAQELDKDPIAIVRAVGYLKMAATKQGQVARLAQERGSR